MDRKGTAALLVAAVALQKHVDTAGANGLASALAVGMAMALSDPNTARRILDECLAELPDVEPAAASVMVAIADSLRTP